MRQMGLKVGFEWLWRLLDVFGFNDEYVEVNNGKNYTMPYL